MKDRAYWNRLWAETNDARPFAPADTPRRIKRILGEGQRYQRGGYDAGVEVRP